MIASRFALSRFYLSRFALSRFYLNARGRDWDYADSLRYAIDRANHFLLSQWRH